MVFIQSIIELTSRDMKKSTLYSFTGFVTLLGIWSPILWFISSAREYYSMGSFEVFKMNWFMIFMFFFLCAITLIAQYGLILISQDLSDFEKLKEKAK